VCLTMERAGTTTETSRFVRALRSQAGGSERSRLVMAMADALSVKPLTEVTDDDVVRRAGLPRAAFFQHFEGGVQECFLATYEACGDLLRTRCVAAVLDGAGRPYDERIALGVRAYLETLASEPGLARAFLRDVLDAGPQALERRREVNERFAAMIRALAEEHADELPEGYAVHPEMARELVEALEELTALSVARGRAAEDLPRLTETATRMIHAALVAGD
jgi:AcrR family transcriptional regulator